MTTNCLSVPAVRRRFAIALVLAGTSQLFGQATPAPSTTAAAASTKDDTITLTPFEVSTSKDVGYAAGNTLSGGRVDTPLAITPGSISVVTRQFMDDFNVTNMNDAGGWMIGVDLGTAVPNSNPAGESVYQNIIRGAPVDNNFPTRDGTVNFGAADAYNTERFEFQRGPDTAISVTAVPAAVKVARASGQTSTAPRPS